MTSGQDIPNLPFKKPKQIEDIETLDVKIREAMDTIEIENRVFGIAHNLADAYYKNNGRDPTTCIAIITTALEELGGFLSGRFGSHMISISEEAANEACKKVFPEDYALIFPDLPES